MMRRIHLLSTVLGTVLLASPALAQRDASSEMHREKGSSAMPSTSMQNRSAGMADEMGRGDAVQLLKQAQDALRQNRTSQAAEMLERAETRMLNRSAMSSAEQPAQGPVVRHSSAARQALMQRDRSTAMREIDMAMSAARDGSSTSMSGGGMSGGTMSRGSTSMGSGSMATGSDMGNRSMQGGGGPSMGRSGMGQSGMQVQPGPAPGSATARDHGMGGSSMSRADLIILAQAGGGSVEGGYPGSPAAGTSSVPQNPGTVTQGTAVPAVPTEGRGPPVPGANVPARPGGANAGPAPAPGNATGTGPTRPGVVR